MGILKFAGKAFLRILKTAVSFATAALATWFLLLVWAYLQQELGFRWMDTAREYAWKYVGCAAFVVCFYETFSLFEAKMTARKKVLVASLGIVFLTSYFSLTYVVQQPAPDITELFQKASPPGPPKPYEEAIYDVYSGLLNGERTQRSLWDKFTDPIPESVMIYVDTIGANSDWFPPGGETLVTEQFENKAVSSAAVDYVRRSHESFQLQRKFNLSKYDLITKSEERAEFDSCRLRQEGCREYEQKHHDYIRWVELSAVGFNEDQTLAFLNLVEWRGGSPHGGYRTLYKRNGKWHLVELTGFSDWVS